VNLYDKFGIGDGEPRRRVALAKEAFRRGVVALPELEAATRRAAGSDDELNAGREAFARRDWDAAWELLSRADSSNPLAAEDLERLAEAGYWTDRHEQSYLIKQRAYQAHLQAGDRSSAAYVALILTIHHANRQDFAVAGGWLAKAERLLGDLPECFAHGHLAFVSALFKEAAGDWPGVLESARLIHEIGCRWKNPDLQALGLAFEGLALTHQGQVADGMRLLDEAMASAVAGELTTMPTGVIYCRMLCASLDLHDYRRATEWTSVIDRCAAKPGLGGLPGDCRAHRAEVLLKRGMWNEGEQEALRALEETERLDLAHVGIAARELGEIRLRMGDLNGAEQAFRRAHEYGTSTEPGMSLLRLARGEVSAAAAALETALAELGDQHLARVRLLPAAVQARLAAHDTTAAKQAVADLEQSAEIYDTPAIKAAAEHARGALELAEGNPIEAAGRLRTAAQLWQRIQAPYDAALTRSLLAEAHLACGDRDGGLLELRAASSILERLGAKHDHERITQRLSELTA
jgi:tetratricopeptide (TPR) repeat protein